MVEKHNFIKVILAVPIKISGCIPFDTEILFLEFCPTDSMLIYVCLYTKIVYFKERSL